MPAPEDQTFLTKRMGLHTVIYSSCTSPCGNYLACGNNYGHVMMFRFGTPSGDSGENSKKPFFVFQASKGPVYQLVTINNVLVGCGYGPITAWSWSALIQKKLTKAWTVANQFPGSEYINSLVYNNKDGVLVAGGSTGEVITWDVKVGKKLDVYTGHESYVHDLSVLPNGFVSVSDDGSMRIWDSRSLQCTGMVEPYKSDDLNRPKRGKHLSCVTTDANGDWIVCGGGPKLALYRTNQLNFNKPLQEDKKDLIPNVVEIFNDEIIAGGNLSLLHRWHMNGERKGTIPCSVNSIFCMTSKMDAGENNRQLPLVLGGADYKLSVFTNLGYESAILKCV